MKWTSKKNQVAAKDLTVSSAEFKAKQEPRSKSNRVQDANELSISAKKP